MFSAIGTKTNLEQVIGFEIDGVHRYRLVANARANYRPEDLLGKQVAAVVNFPSRQIGPFHSEVLTLGFPDPAGNVVLFSPDRKVPNGGRLF